MIGDRLDSGDFCEIVDSRLIWTGNGHFLALIQSGNSCRPELPGNSLPNYVLTSPVPSAFARNPHLARSGVRSAQCERLQRPLGSLPTSTPSAASASNASPLLESSACCPYCATSESTAPSTPPAIAAPALYPRWSPCWPSLPSSPPASAATPPTSCGAWTARPQVLRRPQRAARDRLAVLLFRPRHAP